MKNIKRLCVVIGIAICSLPAFSQTSTQFTVKDTVSDEKVHSRVEKLPVFPGGNAALLKFITENLVYPKEAVKKEIEGVVIVRFVVDKTGKVKNPEILKGLDSLLDKAAKDVVLLLPNFIPGVQAGENVSVYFHVPIQFKLSK